MAFENKIYWIVVAVSVFFSVAFLWFQAIYNPNVYFLSDMGDASWIRDNVSFDINAKPFKKTIKLYKNNFKVDQSIDNIEIYFKGFKFIRVFLNDQLIYESSTKKKKWKGTHTVILDNLKAGEYELVAMVMNYDGPTALLAYAPKLSLMTNGHWQVSSDGSEWSSAERVDQPKTAAISRKFPPAYEKLIETIPIGLVSFVLVIVASRSKFKKMFPITSLKLRWLILGLWGILIVNSLSVTELMGFDMIYHVEYIQYILKTGSLPLATNGLQMFQSPLFYIIGAALVKFFSIVLSPESSFHLLKLIPLICGIGLVEVCYRCSRIVFPDRDDLQSIALIFSAMVPVNLYMSQYIGNEPLYSLISAICILIIVTWFRYPQSALRSKNQILLGFTLGLSLLAKATGLLLILLLLAGFLVILFRLNCTKKVVFASFARVAIIIFVVAGWYYLRNWLLLGKPFIGGWDIERGMTWWQEPGYRTLENFITFGQALIYPVYAATHSFWDAFYSTIWADGLLGSQSTFQSRPPWNYDFLLATVWLSLLPTIGLLAALISPMKVTDYNVAESSAILFCGTTVIIFIITVLFLYFHLPIYSTAKASYTLGVLPCYAILIAFGLSRFMINDVARIILSGILLWWSTCSFLAYFPF